MATQTTQLDPMLELLCELGQDRRVQFHFTKERRCFDGSTDYIIGVTAELSDVLDTVQRYEGDGRVYVNGDGPVPHPVDDRRYTIDVDGMNRLTVEVYEPACRVYPINNGRLEYR